MKIVNVIPNKLLGGAEQAFIDYNEALALKGHEVFAIYNKAGKIKTKIKKAKNIKYLPSIFFKPLMLLFPYYFLKIKIIGPKLIIIHNRKLLNLFSLIGKILKTPVVLVCHTDKTKLIEKADYLFSITNNQKEIFKKSGFDENKIFIIPNMITEKREYSEFKGFSNPPVFGIIGRFDPMKGFGTFIEACHLLKEKNINFLAKIAGSPQSQYMDEYKRIKHLVSYYKLEKHVEFMGWIDNKDEFYNNIDVFVLPSNYEPFGIVLLEAMMYSKPIISSLSEGPSEIFKNNNASLTFSINDAIGLSDKMSDILKDKKLAKELSKNGYELVNKKYTIDVVANTLNDAIKTILKEDDESTKS